MPSWKKVIVSGSAGELSSLYAPSITGSLQGTSSYAITASYAETASFVTASNVFGPYGSNSIISSSYAVTSTRSNVTLSTQILVLNQSGYTITKGLVVHITASGNSSDIPRVISASYESDSFSANTLGIATENITNGSQGLVITEGVLTGVDTSLFQSGQLIYLGAQGTITGSAPHAPLHSVRLGQVIREQSNNGSIHVRVDNGYELGELHDATDLTTSASYGDLLVKSGSVWTNSRQLTGSYALTGSLTVTGSTSTDLVRITQTGTGNAFVVEDSANPDLYPFVITKDGDVGIGTLTPRRSLDIPGGTIYCNEIWNTQGYFLGDMDAGASNVYLTGDGASSTNSYLDLATNGSTKLRITHAGNVGIGTLTPNARLDVNGNAIISDSMVIGSSSLGPFENTLTLGARDNGSEGGQIGFNAPGGTYTSASFIDLYQNRLRILKGTNATSTGEVANWNMHNLQMALPAYSSVSSFPGTAAGYLAFDSSGNIITAAGVGGSPFPYTGSAEITGSISVNNALYTSTTSTANIGSTTIYSVSTSSYDGAWFEYTARSGSNARAGQIMAIWSGSAVNFTETTTTDFGSTSGLSLGVYIVAGAMALTSSATTAGWNIKTIIRSI